MVKSDIIQASSSPVSSLVKEAGYLNKEFQSNHSMLRGDQVSIGRRLTFKPWLFHSLLRYFNQVH